MARILIAEDDPTSALIAARVLEGAGHEVRRVANGLEALTLLQAEDFAVVVTDWMMPDMDGLELIRKIHARFDPIPATVMVTSLAMADARAHALESGADEFVGKPAHPRELIVAVDRALARRNAGIAPFARAIPQSFSPAAPRFPIVVVGANAGGPAALRILLRSCGPAASGAAWVIAQHGLPELLRSLVPVLARETSMPVVQAAHGMPLEPGRVVVAPGGSHVLIAAGGTRIELVQDGDIQHVRPAADPLFRSAAEAAGASCIAVILTGMGRDGTEGAAVVKAAGGRVIVAKPGLHVAAGMAESAIRAGLASQIEPLEAIGSCVTRAIEVLRFPGRAALVAS